MSPPMAIDHEQRRLRHRQEARRAILDAAEALLVEDGYDGLSMRRLAARSGYAAPTIYHHFGDKPGLVDALLEERFQEVVAVLRAAPRRRDPARQVRALVGAFVELMLRNPTHYQLLVTTLREGSEPPSAEEVRGLLEAPLSALLARGQLRAPDVEVAVQALWAFCHGLISLRTSRADLPWAPELLDVALDAMLHGLVGGVGDAERPGQEKVRPVAAAGRRR